MRKKKQEVLDRIDGENLVLANMVSQMPDGPEKTQTFVLVSIFERQGQMIKHLQEIEGNSWLR